ncbi:MAG: ThuA domain-containing protein [Pedobacter sp.]|uniref:ThuA domain-containing protein n=1 Tax=Pedobacter sp. TaxID=1411316 RepID=UPI00339B5617
MKFNTRVRSLLMLLAFFMGNTVYAQKYRILVFSKTAGFHHASIAAGIPAIQKLGIENKFGVDTTTDSTQFTPLNLKKYAAVVFLNTTGNVLGEEEQKSFEQYIKGGGGYVGVHSATDTEYEWPWYGKLAGAYFVKHPAQQMADLHVINRKSIATKHLPATWARKDEWYNFKDVNPDLKVLIELDESTYSGGMNGAHHPMAWYHNYDGGRAFYTGLGHVDASYTDPLFLKHLLGGIQYAMGQKRME